MVRQPVTVNGVTRWKDMDVDGVATTQPRESKGVVLRQEIGDVLRSIRQAEGRTLRDVSHDARVSLGYLSEVERGQKEASSELLAAICDALELRMSELMREVSDELALAELAASAASDAVPAPMRPMLNPVRVTSVTHRPDEHVTIKAPAEAVDVVAA